MGDDYRLAKENGNHQEEILKAVRTAIHSPGSFLGIVCGRPNSHVFEDKNVLEEISSFLKRGDSHFCLVFNGEQRFEFDNRNPDLAAILSHHERADILPIPIIPTTQYLVTDNTLLSQDDGPKMFPDFTKDFFVYRYNKEIAYTWQTLLKKMVKPREPCELKF